jgi:hypothetical protein
MPVLCTAMTRGRFLFTCLLALAAAASRGQCPTTISAFPYQEGFEASAAWTSGGTGNDWAWGTPAKPVITGAGGGTKSWIVGGLTTSNYSPGEQSWLESPCFDFSALPFPFISFKLFWECERVYDGLGFQYSLNQGATWINVGSAADPPDCYTQNWFNAASLNYPQPGLAQRRMERLRGNDDRCLPRRPGQRRMAHRSALPGRSGR